jgi:Thymidylate synthase
LTFDALYYGDRVNVVNPLGDVGLITLWSPFRTVRRKLAGLLDPAGDSRVAAVANLYGDGMLAMLCNLLWNPQVRHLVAVGEDLGLGTCDELDAFLAHGLEDDEMLGRPVWRVPGTARVFPVVPGFDAERLRRGITFRSFGKLSGEGLAERVSSYVRDLPNGAVRRDRVRVELPEASEPAFRPSGSHEVVRARPLDCWEELVVRVMRFGRPVSLRKGRRLELVNAKAVITSPAVEDATELARYGFDLDRFRAYQERILDPVLPEGISYTYGNRLSELPAVVDLLRADPQTRGAYVSLWERDDLGASSKPCLTTLFFRVSAGRLTLTATYRSHNLLWAWLENVYGLMAVLEHVASGAGLDPGPITVISHSLTIDPASPRLGVAQSVADGWKSDDDLDRVAGKYTLRQDPHGYFEVSADRERGVIVAEHRFSGMLVKRYEAARAVAIEREVVADMAVSLPSHAMWLGRELTAKERLLR